MDFDFLEYVFCLVLIAVGFFCGAIGFVVAYFIFKF